jgi:hypothetical protein
MVNVESWADQIDYFPSKTVALGNLSINGDLGNLFVTQRGSWRRDEKGG